MISIYIKDLTPYYYAYEMKRSRMVEVSAFNQIDRKTVKTVDPWIIS